MFEMPPQRLESIQESATLKTLALIGTYNKIYIGSIGCHVQESGQCTCDGSIRERLEIFLEFKLSVAHPHLGRNVGWERHVSSNSIS
jgi:hypothetical protein